MKFAYDKKLADFGLSYLSAGLSTKEYYQNKIDSIIEDDCFDEEEKQFAEWAVNQFNVSNPLTRFNYLIKNKK